MPKVTVKTGTVQDGTYDMDLTSFTLRERAFIKDYSGTKPPEFSEMFFGFDPKTVVATVAVMMQRAGRIPDLDELLDARDDSITLDFTPDPGDKVEEEEDPNSPTPSESDELGADSEKTEASGQGSSKSSDTQPE